MKSRRVQGALISHGAVLEALHGYCQWQTMSGLHITFTDVYLCALTCVNTHPSAHMLQPALTRNVGVQELSAVSIVAPAACMQPGPFPAGCH